MKDAAYHRPLLRFIRKQRTESQETFLNEATVERTSAEAGVVSAPERSVFFKHKRDILNA